MITSKFFLITNPYKIDSLVKYEVKINSRKSGKVITGNNDIEVMNSKYNEGRSVDLGNVIPPNTSKTLAAALTPSKSRLLNTGLEVYVKISDDIKAIIKSGSDSDHPHYEYIKKQIATPDQQCLLRKLLEFKHRTPVDYYTASLNQIEKNPDIYFFGLSESRIRISESITEFDASINNHEVYYYMLRARKDVAPDVKVLSNDKYTYNYYLSDTQDTKAMQVDKVKPKIKAFALLNYFSEDESKEQESYKILGYTLNAPDISSSDTIYEWLMRTIEDNVDAKKIEDFVSVATKLKEAVNPVNRKLLKQKANVKLLLRFSVIKMIQGQYQWAYIDKDNNERVFSWNNEDDIVVDFINKKEHAEAYLAMIDDFERKKGGLDKYNVILFK